MIVNEIKDVLGDINNRDTFIDALTEKQDKWNHYSYNSTLEAGDSSIQIGVPRVSEILDACLGKSYLQTWAAGLGDNYEEERKKILNTGTYAHLMIEDYLKYGYVSDANKVFHKPHYPEQSARCYYNFISWWHNMIEQNFKINIIDIEKTVICPLYGGTADIIARIKDPTGLIGNYIIDFKTSKAISIDYFYQTVMYMNAIEYMNTQTNNPLHIDGVGVVRCDKFSNTYEYLIINKTKDPDFINSIQVAVSNMISWYYNQINSKYQYKLVRNKYLKDDKWV